MFIDINKILVGEYFCLKINAVKKHAIKPFETASKDA